MVVYTQVRIFKINKRYNFINLFLTQMALTDMILVFCKKQKECCFMYFKKLNITRIINFTICFL